MLGWVVNKANSLASCCEHQPAAKQCEAAAPLMINRDVLHSAMKTTTPTIRSFMKHWWLTIQLRSSPLSNHWLTKFISSDWPWFSIDASEWSVRLVEGLGVVRYAVQDQCDPPPCSKIRGAWKIDGHPPWSLACIGISCHDHIDFVSMFVSVFFHLHFVQCTLVLLDFKYM